ncbi:hypothetical protein BU52_16985 [Streptomyces toyocaensis]|uniref:Uncharacterized protein n=1 Tax=Streptomyces toyocaensis TaxID=55952 RepID=A0A081XRD7_STRTO|nr:hypothetical protein BU52_16985 [Streptomyces toyocaensis]
MAGLFCSSPPVVEQDEEITATARAERRRALHVPVREEADVIPELHQVQSQALRGQVRVAAADQRDAEVGSARSRTAWPRSWGGSSAGI